MLKRNRKPLQDDQILPKRVDVVYPDIAKAFDNVSFMILISKIRRFRFDEATKTICDDQQYF